MIDIETEQLVPIRQVPRLLPPRPSGRRVHISAVYRWMSRGIRGVVLESVKVGGSTYTSMEALQRFADRLSAGGGPESKGEMQGAARERQLQQVAERLNEVLRPKQVKAVEHPAP